MSLENEIKEDEKMNQAEMRRDRTLEKEMEATNGVLGRRDCHNVPN